MKQLKKMGAIGGVIAIGLCWPLANGYFGEKIITHKINKINNSGMVHAEVVSYDRSYWSSKVKTHYQILDQNIVIALSERGLPYEFEVDSDIQHKLFSLDIDSILVDLPTVPVTIKKSIKLTGSMDYTITLERWDYHALVNNSQSEIIINGTPVEHSSDSYIENDVIISIAPSVLTGSITSSNDIIFRLDVPSFSAKASNDDYVIEFTNLIAEADGQKTTDGFWVGQQSFSTDLLTLAEYNDLYSIENLSYRLDSTMKEKNSRFTMNHEMKAKRIHFEDDEKMTDAVLDITFADLDVSALKVFMALSNDTSYMDEEQNKQLMVAFSSLFNRGFSISMNKLNLAADSDKPIIVGNFNIALPIADQTSSPNATPFTIIRSLTGDINLLFSKELYEDVIGDEEYVTLTEAGYRFNAKFKDGELILEDKDTNLPLLSLLPMLF